MTFTIHHSAHTTHRQSSNIAQFTHKYSPKLVFCAKYYMYIRKIYAARKKTGFKVVTLRLRASLYCSADDDVATFPCFSSFPVKFVRGSIIHFIYVAASFRVCYSLIRSDLSLLFFVHFSWRTDFKIHHSATDTGFIYILSPYIFTIWEPPPHRRFISHVLRIVFL